jgi:hypothetical protein
MMLGLDRSAAASIILKTLAGLTAAVSFGELRQAVSLAAEPGC